MALVQAGASSRQPPTCLGDPRIEQADSSADSAGRKQRVGMRAPTPSQAGPPAVTTQCGSQHPSDCAAVSGPPCPSQSRAAAFLVSPRSPKNILGANRATIWSPVGKRRAGPLWRCLAGKRGGSFQKGQEEGFLRWTLECTDMMGGRTQGGRGRLDAGARLGCPSGKDPEKAEL